MEYLATYYLYKVFPRKDILGPLRIQWERHVYIRSECSKERPDYNEDEVLALVRFTHDKDIGKIAAFLF